MGDWREQFDVLWHGGLPTDGGTKGGLLAPRDQRVDPNWVRMEPYGAQVLGARKYALGEPGQFNGTVSVRRLAQAQFRARAKAEVDAAEARRVALCKRWTGRAS